MKYEVSCNTTISRVIEAESEDDAREEFEDMVTQFLQEGEIITDVEVYAIEGEDSVLLDGDDLRDAQDVLDCMGEAYADYEFGSLFD